MPRPGAAGDGRVFEKGESEETAALNDLTEAIRLDPNDAAAALVTRGLIYCHQDKLEPAIADFTLAIKLDPNNSERSLRPRASLLEQGWRR